MCGEEGKHDDHAKRVWVRTLFHLDLEDTSLFSVALDVSRFTTEQVAGILRSAGGG